MDEEIVFHQQFPEKQTEMSHSHGIPLNADRQVHLASNLNYPNRNSGICLPSFTASLSVPGVKILRKSSKQPGVDDI